MGDPRPRNLPAGTLIPVTATRPTFLATAKRSAIQKKVWPAAQRKMRRRKATAALRKRCHAKTYARGSSVPAVRPKAAQEFPAARGAREGCGTSLCRRCIPELRRLLRNSGLRGRAKSPRYERLRESPAKRRELLERRGSEILDFDAALAFFRFGVDGNILLKMTLEPALVIQRFANRDAVEPRFQRAALAETANAAKGLQENFLGAVGGIGSIAQHAENEVIDRCMIVSDEPVEGRLRACLQLVDEFGFIAAPAKGTSPIGHCRPFRPDVYQHPFLWRP